MVVYLPSAEDNVIHLHEVLERLKRAGFTLNPDKGTLGAREIKYLGHLHASWRIKILTWLNSIHPALPPPKKFEELKEIHKHSGVSWPVYSRLFMESSRITWAKEEGSSLTGDPNVSQGLSR